MLSAILALLASAQPHSPPPPIIAIPTGEVHVYSSREAVLGAADRAPRTMAGTFVLWVQRTGREGDRVYLNSESDYRDHRNLTISLDPSAVHELTERFGAPPDQYFRGRLVAVTGLARRTQIDFIGEGGRRTGLYYFQTQVPVSGAWQIGLFEPAARRQSSRQTPD